MRNVKLNFLKGFACLSVVLIHIKFPGVTGEIVAVASDYAVPIFLIIAGYYAYEKNETVIKRRLKKICIIFVAAYFFKLTYTIVSSLYKHEDLTKWFSENFSPITPVKYIAFCDLFAVTLWYLFAMIEIYILWLIIVKKGKEDIAVKVMPVLFALQIILNVCGKTLGNDLIYKVFLTRAFPWFLLGYYINTPRAEKLRSLRKNLCVILAVSGCGIAIAPIVFDIPVKFSDIGYIPYALGLFLLTLDNPEKSTCKLLEFIGDKLSLFIYILHMNVDGALYSVWALLNIDTESNTFLWIRPFVVILLSIVVSWGVYAIIKLFKKSHTDKKV